MATQKLLTIIYDQAIHPSISELLEALEVPGVTYVSGVLGFGGRGPKRNDPIFPGCNNLALVAIPAERVEAVRRALRRLQDSFRLKPGITILCQDVEELP